jgi:Xaa-Pro dipeptidase
MKKEGMDALLLYSSGEGGPISYLTGYLSNRPTFLIYPLEGDPTLIVYFYNHLPCAHAMSIVSDIQWDYNQPALKIVDNITSKGLSNGSIGIVGLNSIPFTEYTEITKRLAGCKFSNLGKEINAIRAIKSEEELEWFRRSAYLTDLTVEALEKKIRPGLTEHDLISIIHNAFLTDDGQATGPIFLSSTDMSNPDTFVPWQYPTSKVLKKGHVVLTEISVAYYGYRAQIHRPFAVGVEPTHLYGELFDVALECFERVSRVLRPGATSEDVIKASSVIEERGFTIYDSLVHGEGGKNPELGSKSSAHPFEPFTFGENMIVVIQPQPITKDLRAGLQLGAATVVTANGAKSLHNYPFKFPVCGL